MCIVMHLYQTSCCWTSSPVSLLWNRVQHSHISLKPFLSRTGLWYMDRQDLMEDEMVVVVLKSLLLVKIFTFMCLLGCFWIMQTSCWCIFGNLSNLKCEWALLWAAAIKTWLLLFSCGFVPNVADVCAIKRAVILRKWDQEVEQVVH